MNQMNRAANAYKSVQVDAAVLGASPHELIEKLFARAIELTKLAKVQMQNGEITAKGQAIKLVIAILSDGLRGSLNMEEGGEIAENLDALYEYMTNQLLKAHAENDPEILDEVISLLTTVKSGWDGIKPQPTAQPQQLQPEL